jgi:hypothetical protein
MMNTGVGLSQATSEHFERVFTSSNNFVLVHKVLYPKTTIVSMSMDKNKVKYGESIHITGTVTDSEGERYGSGTIRLLDSVNGGPQESIATASLVDGEFTYDWTPPAGNHSVRAFWSGVKGESTSAVSDPASLFVEPKPVTLSVALANYNVTVGQNVTISLRLSQNLSNGTFTIRYSSNNKTWTDLVTVQPQNGTIDYSWAPATAGTMYIQATYSGAGNFGPATSSIVVLTVEP